MVVCLYAADIGELIGGDNFHVSHQKGWIETGIGDAPFHIAAGNAYLAQNVGLRGDHGIIGLAAQDVDGAAGEVAIFAFIGEQRPGRGIGKNPPTGLILVERPLQ